MNLKIVVSSNNDKLVTSLPIVEGHSSNATTVINRTKKRHKYWPKSVCAREVVSLYSTDEIFAGAIICNKLEVDTNSFDTIQVPSQEEEVEKCEPEQTTASADLRSKLNIFKRPALPPFRPVRSQPQQVVDDDVLSIYAPSNFSFSTTIEDNLLDNDHHQSPASLHTDKLQNISTWLNTGYTTSSHSDQSDQDNDDVTDAVVTVRGNDRCSSPSAYSTVSDWTTMSMIVEDATPATTTIKPPADKMPGGGVLLHEWKRPTEYSRCRLGPPAKRLATTVAPSRLPQIQSSGKVTVGGVSGLLRHNDTFESTQNSVEFQPRQYSTPNKQNPHVFLTPPPLMSIHQSPSTIQKAIATTQQYNNNKSEGQTQTQLQHNNTIQQSSNYVQRQTLRNNQQQSKSPQQQSLQSNNNGSGQQQQSQSQLQQSSNSIQRFDNTIDKQTQQQQRFQQSVQKKTVVFKEKLQQEVANSCSKKGLVPPQTIQVTANFCKPNEKAVVHFKNSRQVQSIVSPGGVHHQKQLLQRFLGNNKAIVDNSLENDRTFPQQQQTFVKTVVSKSSSQQRTLKLLSSPRQLNQTPPDQRKNLNNNPLAGQLNPNKQPLLGQLNPNKQLLGQPNPNKQQLLGQLNHPVLLPSGQLLSDLIIYKNCEFLSDHPTCLSSATPHHDCASLHHYDMSSLRALLSAAPLATLQRTYRELMAVTPHRLWPLFGGFVAGFGAAGSRRDLYQMVVRVMEEDVYKTPLLEEVIGALCGLGMAYREAVGGLLKYVGYQNQNLVALLLSLLVEQSTTIKSDWALISDLLDNVAHIDHGVMADLLHKCVNESVTVDMREILRSLAQLLLKQETSGGGAVSSESCYPLLCKIPADQIASFRRVLGNNGLGEYAGMLGELLQKSPKHWKYRNSGEQFDSRRMDDFQEEFDDGLVNGQLPETRDFDYSRLPPPPVVPSSSIIGRVQPPPTLQHRLPSLPPPVPVMRRVPPTATTVTSPPQSQLPPQQSYKQQSQQQFNHQSKQQLQQLSNHQSKQQLQQQSNHQSKQQLQQQVVVTNRPDYGQVRIRPPYSYSTQTSQSLSTSSIEDSSLLQQETNDCYPGLNYLIANNTPSDSDNDSPGNATPEINEENVDPRLATSLPTFDMIRTTVITFILGERDCELMSLFAKFSHDERELVKPVCKLIFEDYLPVISSYEIFLKMWNNMVTVNSEYLQPILLSFGLNLYEFLTEQEFYKESAHLLVTINKNQLLLRNKPYYSNLHNSTIMERCHHIINTFVCANYFKEAFEWFQLHAYHTVSVGPLDKQFLVTKRELLDSFLNNCTDLNICYKLVLFCLVKNVPLDYGRHFNVVVIKILNSNHKSLLLDDMELVLKYREHLSVSALRGLVVEYFNHLTTTQSMMLFNQLTSLEIYPLLEADSTVIYLSIGLLSEEIRLILNAYINLKAAANVDGDSDRITEDVTLFIERRVTSVDRATPVYPKNLINTAVDVAGMRVRLVNTLKLCYPPVLPVLVEGGGGLEEEQLGGNTVLVTATSLRALLAGRRLRDGAGNK